MCLEIHRYTGSMAFDLHTHSNCSDGTQPPAEVVRCAAEAGLDGIALTDHDTTEGWSEAAHEAHTQGIALIRGTEISCVSAAGVSVHLLSYLHDPNNEELNAEIARARESRVTRAQKMTELLAEDFPITWESVQHHTYHGATVGRPHIADALVAAGVVDNRSAAFGTILRSDSKYYVAHYAPDPALAVELVRKAGGVPVFAHPRAMSRGRVVADHVVHEMIDAGLAGVEIYHRDNDPEGKVWLQHVAADHGLIVTGSSDYHGAGKPNQLGENSVHREVVEQIAATANSAIGVLWNGR